MVTEACFSRRAKSKEPDHTGNQTRERLDGLAKANSLLGYVISELSGNVEIRQEWSKETCRFHRFQGYQALVVDEKTHPNRISLERNRKIPLKSTQVVSEPARGAEFFSGRRKGQQAKATSYEQEGEYITRWIGQYPSRKAADVTLVSYPKNL